MADAAKSTVLSPVALEAGTEGHYVDGAHYDHTYRSRRADQRFYVALARERDARAVLELGVGTGRVAIALARDGREVVGVDRMPPMLDRLRDRIARERAEVRARVSLVLGDVCSVRLRRRFPLVIAPFNVFMHLYTRRDVERFLARVRAHLAPKGTFVFDVALPSLTDLGRDPERAYRTPPFRHPSAGVVRYAEHYDYDPLRQVLDVRMCFAPKRGRPFETPLSHRQFFPQELEALLHYNGFAIEKALADFGRPLDRHADVMVIFARKRR